MQIKQETSLRVQTLDFTQTTTYNLEGNNKNECRHSLIVKAVVKACKVKIFNWPKLLSIALWVDCTIYSIVTRYMPVELMLWIKIDDTNREGCTYMEYIILKRWFNKKVLLALQIQRPNSRLEYIEIAITQLIEVR